MKKFKPSDVHFPYGRGLSLGKAEWEWFAEGLPEWLKVWGGDDWTTVIPAELIYIYRPEHRTILVPNKLVGSYWTVRPGGRTVWRRIGRLSIPVGIYHREPQAYRGWGEPFPGHYAFTSENLPYRERRRMAIKITRDFSKAEYDEHLLFLREVMVAQGYFVVAAGKAGSLNQPIFALRTNDFGNSPQLRQPAFSYFINT